MAFKLKSPGTNILGAFASGIKDGPQLDDEYTPHSSHHMPAYAVSVRDLVNLQTGQTLDDIAKEVAWQCVAVGKSGRVAVGEVSPRSKASRPAGHVFDGPVKMSSLSYGPIINSAYKTMVGMVTTADDLIHKYQVKGDHEPRMLRIPGLLVTAIWLKSQTAGETDWVVPLHTHINGLTTGLPLPMQSFLGAVRPVAQARMTASVLD